MSFVSVPMLGKFKEINIPKEEFIQKMTEEAKKVKESIKIFSDTLKTLFVSENDSDQEEIDKLVDWVSAHLKFDEDPIVEEQNNLLVVNNTYVFSDSKEELSQYTPKSNVFVTPDCLNLINSSPHRVLIKSIIESSASTPSKQIDN